VKIKSIGQMEAASREIELRIRMLTLGSSGDAEEEQEVPKEVADA
jgi:hypothetical protein